MGHTIDTPASAAALRVREHQLAALEQARSADGSGPQVGAVIARGQHVIAVAYRHEQPGMHAEQLALLKAQVGGHDVRGAQLYTTLEPCAGSRTNRVPCAQLIADAGIGTVLIGAYDQNASVYRLGWKRLRDARIQVLDFDPDLLDQAKELSASFAETFTDGYGLTGGARFDFTLNGGRFVLHSSREPDALQWTTRWTSAGARSIHAYAGVPGVLAHARFATAFDEIDNPDALDYVGHTHPVQVGEIVVFRGPGGHALVQVVELEPTADHGGGDHASVKIRWQLRISETGARHGAGV